MSTPSVKVKIKVQGYDPGVVERSVKMIVETAVNTGAAVVGPVFLPTKRKVWCVLRSPHIDKRSMEHFEMRIHTRSVIIESPTVQTIDALQHLELPVGVKVVIKQ